MAVNVNKPGHDCEAGDVEPQICLSLAQVPDLNHAIAADADIRDNGFGIVSGKDRAARENDAQRFAALFGI